jgi:hypothetical protein
MDIQSITIKSLYLSYNEQNIEIETPYQNNFENGYQVFKLGKP